MKYGFVAERIADLSMLFDIKAIAFDQYRIKYLEPELENASVSVPLIPHGQGILQGAGFRTVDASFDRTL